MACLHYHLRSKVLSSSIEIKTSFLPDTLGQTKVYNFDVSIFVEHDVLELHVSVHVALLMQSSQAVDNLGPHELNLAFREPPHFSEGLVKLASLDEWHHKVKSELALEDEMHAGQIRM